LAVDDFDGDGRADLAAAIDSIDNVSVLLATGGSPCCPAWPRSPSSDSPNSPPQPGPPGTSSPSGHPGQVLTLTTHVHIMKDKQHSQNIHGYMDGTKINLKRMIMRGLV
jgi:hypothetical protein